MAKSHIAGMTQHQVNDLRRRGMLSGLLGLPEGIDLAGPVHPEDSAALEAAGITDPVSYLEGLRNAVTGPEQLQRADLAHMTPHEIHTAKQAGKLRDLLAGNIERKEA